MPGAEVWATVVVPGFHHWDGAPRRRAYLAGRHRHEFHLTVAVAVGHDDRETEFHDLSDWLRSWWGPRARECGGDSCEMLARKLAADLASEELVTVTRAEVSEDGQAGAVVYPQEA
jgi:hypothetical protein